MLPFVLLFSLLTAEANAKVVIQVSPGQTFQQFDGLGISQAFQRARQIYGSDGLSPANTEKVLNLLFSNRTGAGLTILRNGIGSSAIEKPRYDFMTSIAGRPPTAQGVNGSILSTALAVEKWNATSPRYAFDGDDNGQLQLTRDALIRGLQTVYADAWSAPAWMKSNMNDSSGGSLCGVAGFQNCPQGDMRRAYAEYLAKYIKFYEDAGVRIDVLGFLNEPDFNVTYASMLSTGNQAADFLKILHPYLHSPSNNLSAPPQIACCDGAGWEQSREQLAGIQHANASNLIDIFTSHGYISPPSTPFATPHRVWQTEWADLDSGYTTQEWYRNGSAGEGLTWAKRIQDGFVKSNLSAFLAWIGAGNTTTNSALILLRNDTVTVSKRLWAFGQFGRFVRPGAVRIHTSIIPSNITANSSTGIINVENHFSISAFAQPNEKGYAIQVINNSNDDDCVQIQGVSTAGAILRRYLTNEQYDITKMNIESHRGPGPMAPQNGLTPAPGDGAPVVEECVGNVVGTVPARSMVSFVVERLVPII